MLPFGFPACCVLLISDTYIKYPYSILLSISSCILGTISTGLNVQSYIILLSIAFVTSAFFVVKKFIDITNVKILYISIFSVAVSSLCAFTAFCFVTPTVGDISKIIIQGIIIFTVFYMYRIAEHHINYSKILSQEELALLAIIIMIAVLGFPDIVLFGLSLRNMLSLLLVMIISFRGGFGAGAAAGVVIGLLTRYDSPVTICLYAFCGFLSGLFKRYGKFTSVLAFCAGNTVLAFFMGGLPQIISGMYETGMAVIVFILLPKRISELIRIPVLEQKIDKIDNIYERRMCMNAIKKISNFSEMFKSLSLNVPGHIMKKYVSSNDEDVIRIYNKVCTSCDMKRVCWKQESDMTQKYIHNAVSTVESGKYTYDQFKKQYADVCINVIPVIEEIENACEIKKINKISDMKINEYKKLISNQMNEISKMSDILIDDIKHGMDFNREKEKLLITSLKSEEIRVLDTIIINECRQDDYVTIYVKGDFRRTTIEKIVSKIMEREYVIKKVNKQNKGIYEILCIVKPMFFTSVSVKQFFSDKKICGDSYKIIDETPWGQCMVISDGMGVGKEANRQSNTVIKIIEMYIKSGVNIKNSIDLINLMLGSGNDDIQTATLDVCMINAYEKKAVFSKSGSPESIIVHKNGDFDIISTGTLPVGTNISENGSSIKSKSISIDKGDFIVMYTDGIVDSFIRSGVDNAFFYKYICDSCKQYDGENSEEMICSEIMQRALACPNEEKDDMTVAVIAIL